MPADRPLRVRDTVVVKRYPAAERKITYLDGKTVMLDWGVAGTQWWSKGDLRRVPARKVRRAR